MQNSGKIHLAVVGIGLFAFLLLISTAGLAQGTRETIDATAYGTSTQMGRNFTVRITIESYSPPEDQQVLLNALRTGGTQAMVDVLERLPARGRISLPSTVGYTVSYIRVWPTATGRRIRLVTNRPIAFGELWGGTRSRDYSVSAIELDLNSDKSKSTGTLLPAAQLKMTGQNDVEIEAFQNPWRLTNIIEWDR